MIDILIQDIRYGLRLIRKAPGFSAVAITSLAVGIGASTVLFSFTNALLFRPVNAANAQHLIRLFTSNFEGPTHLYGNSSFADYEDFKAAPVFESLTASRRVRATLSANERPDVINGLLVSGNYFDVLGVPSSRGRIFRAGEDDMPASEPVIVLSDDGWRRRFAADPAIVGRVVELSGQSFTVIGVGPPRFAGTGIEDMAEFFAPVSLHSTFDQDENLVRNRRSRGFTLLGRLKAGVALSASNAALANVAADLVQQDPVAWRDRTGHARIVTVLPEIEARMAGAPRGAAALIFASVLAGVVALLGIACVNVATVLLARASTRRKEIALRLALGASRRRMIRQLLTECALLAGAGGALGFAIAQSAAVLFQRFRPAEVPAFDLTVDYRILLFGAAAAFVTVVFAGLAPALQTTRPDLNVELKGMTRAVRARGFRFDLRSALVVVQVAVSLALTVGAALMLKSAHAGRNADPGFRRDTVLSVGIDLSTVADLADARAHFYDDAVRLVSTLPAVEKVALAALVPMDGSNMQTELRIAASPSPISVVPDINIVGPGYFALLDVPVKQGREFMATDHRTAPAVAVVNESMARKYWDGNPVGQTFTDTFAKEAVQIVGVVGDLRHRSFGEAPRPMVYFSAGQRSRPSMTLHVRTTATPAAIGPAMERALHDINRAAGIAQVETMRQFFDRMSMPQQLGASGAMATALLEMALAVMALYGVIAFAASQRKREIGLRMALGASPRSVLSLIMREGLLLTSVGVVLGVFVALIAGALFQSELGIELSDPVSFAGAIVALLLVGAVASYVPARRALKVDPSSALRSE